MEPIKVVRCSGSTKENPHRQHASPAWGCMVIEAPIPTVRMYVREAKLQARKDFARIIKANYISRKEVEEAIDNITNSIKQHTVPEGQHLVTRSYVLNTLEYERAKLLPPTKGGNDE